MRVPQKEGYHDLVVTKDHQNVSQACANTLDNICSTQDIERFVREIECDWNVAKGLILSEHDAQCLLYSKISTHLAGKDHSTNKTEDDYLASPLHTEVDFLDKRGKLTIRPDMVLFETDQLNLTKKCKLQLVQRKSFSFRGSTVVIELKFCKYLKGVTPSFTKLVERDCRKIKDLHKIHYSNKQDDTLSGLVVVFSRSNQRCEEFDQLIQEYSSYSVVRIVYATCNLNQQ